jgi:hypothetical protein
MNARGILRHPFSTWLFACLVIPMLLSACQPQSAPNSLPSPQPPFTAQPAQLTPAAESPVQDAQPPSGSLEDITFDLSGVAQDQTVATIAALPASSDDPYWASAPQHRLVTLQGYPVADRELQPRIYIFPMHELAVFSEQSGSVSADLRSLLQSRQPGESMPFLPLVNGLQALHAQVQYLDIMNGTGVRYLTQYNQGPVPINNLGLLYTFQGLTSDGSYYVAAVLPLTHPELPDSREVNARQPEDLNGFPAYLDKTTAWLDQQPADSFTPGLERLDVLVRSIEVR